uniref:antitoxin family protein n=1 Tax=Okeania sp. SIO2F4 TaxID=2607790 RepID=UPI0025FEEEC6|nr:antitoxin family protein [Okeania sp. SIO2F4]
MILEAVYEQGVLRLTKPLNLPEGTRVEITLVKSRTNFQQQKPADILAAFASLPLEGEQDEQLQQLMNKFHESQDNQQLLSREEQQELEELAVAELTAATERTREILANLKNQET